MPGSWRPLCCGRSSAKNLAPSCLGQIITQTPCSRNNPALRPPWNKTENSCSTERTPKPQSGESKRLKQFFGVPFELFRREQQLSLFTVLKVKHTCGWMSRKHSHTPKRYRHTKTKSSVPSVGQASSILGQVPPWTTLASSPLARSNLGLLWPTPWAHAQTWRTGCRRI